MTMQTIIHDTTIVTTGPAGSVQYDAALVVENDRIAAIGQANKIKPPKDAQVIDARGKFLIPGLWDMHVHVVDAGEGALGDAVTAGVTGIRDLGGELSMPGAARSQPAHESGP